MSEYEQEQFYLLLKNDFDLFNAFVLEQSGPGATSLFEEMFNNVLNTKAFTAEHIKRQEEPHSLQ